MQMYVDASGISEATDAAQAPILSPWVTKEALPTVFLWRTGCTHCCKGTPTLHMQETVKEESQKLQSVD
jgi:hypothetical protein